MASMYSEDEKTDVESAIVLTHPYVPTLPSIPGRGEVLEREKSLSITNDPTKINPKAKIVGEFRTLRCVL